MAYRRDKILLAERAQKRRARQPRCRAHHIPRCDAPSCIRAAHRPKTITHKSDPTSSTRHASRNGDFSGHQAQCRLDELFRSLRLPRVEIEPFEGARQVYSESDRKKSLRELIKQSQ